ncbi:MAG: winged helix-turn-helix domain-containing protein [Chloroflexi bacterium]|nr:winged helix-turn-helix domain-containing protein [Chloroflexota bacterium]
MMRQAIYFAGSSDIDVAVKRGLLQAECRVYQAKSVAETLTLLEHQATERHMLRVTESLVVLVAEIEGSMMLLETMWQRGLRMPPVLLIDRVGGDVERVRRCVRLGVREYLLPWDDESKRESRARMFVESAAQQLLRWVAPVETRTVSLQRSRRLPNPMASLDLRWDVGSHTIFIGDSGTVQLSPAEARTFDLLYTRRGKTVGIEELIEFTLAADRDRNPQREIQLLRTHLARLRRRLAAHPGFGYRIENLRGNGYTML